VNWTALGIAALCLFSGGISAVNWYRSAHVEIFPLWVKLSPLSLSQSRGALQYSIPGTYLLSSRDANASRLPTSLSASISVESGQCGRINSG